MAKKKTFGSEAQEQKGDQKRRAKVIVATKTDNNKFGYKEAMVNRDDVQDFIKENRA